MNALASLALLVLASLTLAVPGSRFPVQGSSVQGSLVRFHHVHYRVADPSEAMADAVAKFGGTREVVSGLGVGVRRGDDFLLYDRLSDADPPDLMQRALPNAYEDAVEWLRARGINVAPGGSVRVSGLPPSRYHHLGFATHEFEAAVARAGTPIERRPDSAIFAAGNGVLVEIVRDMSLPDAYWCPMHPDVRSAAAGKCPQCGMDLVSIPPPKVGEYKLDVVLQRDGKGARGMRLTVRAPDTNEVVRRFESVHEKLFHLFVVSRDLEYFAHVHPDAQRDGSFGLTHPLPAGEYMLIADFVPTGGTAQTLQRAIVVGVVGVRSRFSNPSGLENRDLTPRETVVDGMRVSLKVEDAVVGKEACLTFTLTDEKTGAPVTDLEPYLGAPAHMLMVRADLGDAIHAHPEELQTSGPRVSFHPLIPADGPFKLWIQVQRAGRVITVPFWITATK